MREGELHELDLRNNCRAKEKEDCCTDKGKEPFIAYIELLPDDNLNRSHADKKVADCVKCNAEQTAAVKLSCKVAVESISACADCIYNKEGYGKIIKEYKKNECADYSDAGKNVWDMFFRSYYSLALIILNKSITTIRIIQYTIMNFL